MSGAHSAAVGPEELPAAGVVPAGEQAVTSAIETLLRDLQGAIAARRLYASDQPRFQQLVDRVVGAAAVATTGGEDVEVFCLDGRLVWKGRPVPGAEAFVKGLFATLGAHGFQRIAIRRGLSSHEAATFVDAIVRADAGGAAPASSTHLRLSSYDTGSVAAPRAEDQATASEEHEGLQRIWDGIVRRREYDLDDVEFMLLALSRTIHDNVGAAIPLATLRAHDDYTIVHIVNVALLSMALAEAVGFGPALVKDVGLSALLHDVGKLDVPAEVLNETGRLTEEQRRLIRRHPENGARILLCTPKVPELAVTVAYEHHLQYDGGGYPTVPRSWKVNLASAITHVADVFDALRTHRPYRPAVSRDRIVELMMRDAGTVFDPGLVRVFFDQVIPRTTETCAGAETLTSSGAETGSAGLQAGPSGTAI